MKEINVSNLTKQNKIKRNNKLLKLAISLMALSGLLVACGGAGSGDGSSYGKEIDSEQLAKFDISKSKFIKKLWLTTYSIYENDPNSEFTTYKEGTKMFKELKFYTYINGDDWYCDGVAYKKGEMTKFELLTDSANYRGVTHVTQCKKFNQISKIATKMRLLSTKYEAPNTAETLVASTTEHVKYVVTSDFTLEQIIAAAKIGKNPIDSSQPTCDPELDICK